MRTTNAPCKSLFRLFILLSTFSPFLGKAQVGIGIAAPQANAMLHIESTTRGLLLPRVTTAERDLIAVVPSRNGLMVYNTTTQTVQVYRGAPTNAWQDVGGALNLPIIATDPTNATSFQITNTRTGVATTGIAGFIAPTAGSTSAGVYGQLDGTAQGYGVTGYVNSTAAGSAGVFGSTQSNTAVVYGVRGNTNSSNAAAAGVQGTNGSAGAGIEGVNSAGGPGGRFSSTSGPALVVPAGGGNVGIGVVAPAALLGIGAGTAARPSLNIATGVNPGTPVTGDIWVDATGNLIYRNSTTSVNLSGGGTGVNFDVSTFQNSTSPTNYLFDIQNNSTGVSLGARLQTVAGGANNNATGLTITASATGAGTATALNVSASGGGTRYTALFAGGNVGIGIAAPVTPLDVTGTNNTASIRGINNSTAASAAGVRGEMSGASANPNYGVLGYTSSNNTSSAGVYGSTNTNAAGVRGSSIGGAPAAIFENTGSGPALIVPNASGYVGIGVPAPTSLLELAGFGTTATQPASLRIVPKADNIDPAATALGQLYVNQTGDLRYRNATTWITLGAGGGFSLPFNTGGTPDANQSSFGIENNNANGVAVQGYSVATNGFGGYFTNITATTGAALGLRGSLRFQNDADRIIGFTNAAPQQPSGIGFVSVRTVAANLVINGDNAPANAVGGDITIQGGNGNGGGNNGGSINIFGGASGGGAGRPGSLNYITQGGPIDGGNVNLLSFNTGGYTAMMFGASGGVLGAASPSSNAQPLGLIRFRANNVTAANPNFVGGAEITSVLLETPTATSAGAALIFGTSPTGAGSLTNPIERMRITPAGFVGIGTPTPQTNLHVAGSATELATGVVINNIRTGGGNQGFAGLALQTGTVPGSEPELSMSLSNSQVPGNYATGIPNANLAVISADPQTSGLAIATESGTAKISLVTNGAERMSVLASGNVGIGTAAPTARLHLPAGAAAAGAAPLKITATGSTLLSTTEPGAIESDGDALYFTNSIGTRQQFTGFGAPNNVNITGGSLANVGINSTGMTLNGRMQSIPITIPSAASIAAPSTSFIAEVTGNTVISNITGGANGNILYLLYPNAINSGAFQLRLDESGNIIIGNLLGTLNSDISAGASVTLVFLASVNKWVVVAWNP